MSCDHTVPLGAFITIYSYYVEFINMIKCQNTYNCDLNTLVSLN